MTDSDTLAYCNVELFGKIYSELHKGLHLSRLLALLSNVKLG